MFRNEIKKDSQKTKGFTLIEALVAFSVLVIAFSAFISSTTTSMKAFRSVERSHLASMMAKEGIELIFSKKSNGYRACVILNECNLGVDWDYGLEEGSYEVSSYRYEELLPGERFSGFDEGANRPRPLCFLSDEVPNPPSSPDPTPGSKGRFGYCTGQPDEKDSGGDVIPGNFYREIIIESLGGGSDEMDPDGILVKSIVRWGGTNNDDAPYETVLEAYLYAN
jgi:type II secretory pathway pseudopilin PulG